MIFLELIGKSLDFFKKLLVYIFFQWPRVLKYTFLSSCKNVIGSPIKYQPVQILGKGEVFFNSNVRFGVNQSPFFYSGYIYIDARKSNSIIAFGKDIWVNNNCSFISDGAGIEIGENTIIGASCEFIDSDFHSLSIARRFRGVVKVGRIVIKKNVFIANNVKVLKGVTIGENSVIANGSVVTKSIPPNVIAAGVPARVIKKIAHD